MSTASPSEPAMSPDAADPRLLATIVGHLSDAIIVTDARLRITAFMGAAERMYGWHASEVIGRHLSADFTLEFPDDDGVAFATQMAAGATARANLRALRKDGRWIDLDVQVAPLLDAHGAITGWLSVARDASPMIMAARAIKAREAQLRGYFESPGVGVVIVAPDACYEDANDAFCAMLGYTRDELAARTWRQLTYLDDLEPEQRLLDELFAGTRDSFQVDKRYERKDGRLIWALTSVSCVRNTDGKVEHLVGIVIDISARRQADEQLRSALYDNELLVVELRQALHRVKTLAGLLPICMHCKRIRDDEGYWERIEEYISAHTDALFSHGICPECLTEHYPTLRGEHHE